MTARGTPTITPWSGVVVKTPTRTVAVALGDDPRSVVGRTLHDSGGDPLQAGMIVRSYTWTKWAGADYGVEYVVYKVEGE